MIISKSIDIKTIIKKINKEPVFILGCSECATICKTGGLNEINELKKKLEINGINVIGSVILEPACHRLNNKRILKKYSKQLNEAYNLIVLSCGNGAQTISEQFEDKNIICGTNTIFLGQIKHLYEFDKKCNLCGNCIINNFYGLCLITRCPKNMLNGPCGGSINGKCEINSDMDCIWYIIVKKFDNKNKIDKLKKIIEPFDWSSKNIWKVKV